MAEDTRSFFDGDELSEELQGLIKPELAPGERLLWASRSGTRSPFGDRAPLMVGCLWTAGFFLVCVVCLVPVITLTPLPQKEKLDGVLGVVGVLSGIIGLFVLIGTISVLIQNGTERQRLKGRVYALTDRRAIIWCPQGKSAAIKIYTFPSGSVKADSLHRVQFPDGSGDVVFQGDYYHDPSGFTGIADVRRVEELVRRFLVDPGAGSS